MRRVDLVDYDDGYKEENPNNGTCWPYNDCDLIMSLPFSAAGCEGDSRGPSLISSLVPAMGR